MQIFTVDLSHVRKLDRKGVIVVGLLKDLFSTVFNSRFDPSTVDWEAIHTSYKQTHLQQSALDVVVGKIITICNLVVFKTDEKDLDYRLNVKPNDNQNALDFRSEMIRRILVDGEALIVKKEDGWYLADSWSVDDKAMKAKTYSNVFVGGMRLYKRFTANDVLHIKYHNKKLKKYLNDLNDTYAKLFERVIDVHMRDQQIRIFAKFPGLAGKSEAERKAHAEIHKKFLRGLSDQIKNESVVVVPRQDDYEVEEKSQSYLGRSVSEVGLVENIYITRVANALQVPPLLFSDDFADVSHHNENMIRWCIKPLIELITTEINAKCFTKYEYKKGKHVRANYGRAIYTDEFAMAKDVEKMVGSGVWTIDDVLESLGRQRIGTEETTRRYMTKNLAPIALLEEGG